MLQLPPASKNQRILTEPPPLGTYFKLAKNAHTRKYYHRSWFDAVFVTRCNAWYPKHLRMTSFGCPEGCYGDSIERRFMFLCQFYYFEGSATHWSTDTVCCNVRSTDFLIIDDYDAAMWALKYAPLPLLASGELEESQYHPSRRSIHEGAENEAMA